MTLEEQMMECERIAKELESALAALIGHSDYTENAYVRSASNDAGQVLTHLSIASRFMRPANVA